MTPSGEKASGARAFPPGSWLTLAFAAGVTLLLWTSFDLSRASAWVPRWVLAITLILLLLRLARELLAARSAAALAGKGSADGRRNRAWRAVAWIGLLLLFTWLLGSAPGGAIFCCAWLRWHAGESWPVSLALAAGLGIAVWLLFRVVLGIGLYSGFL
jgi:Tripartite tricarboxylate transporter TctB family